MESTSFKQLLGELEQIPVRQRVISSFEQIHNKDRERIRQELERLDNKKSSNVSDAQSRTSYSLNRFFVIPYNHNRVKLKEGGNDYINATHIKLPDNISTTKYIATQGPINHTIGDFWQMVWEQKALTIVMVTKTAEGEYSKCAEYWPSAVGKPFLPRLSSGSTSVVVTLLDSTHLSAVCPSLVERNFVLTHKLYPGKSRTVRQLHFTAWPDRGLPKSPEPLVRLIDAMNLGEQFKEDKDSPIIVHCSAGVGRTGTFILLDAARQYFATHSDYDGDFVADAFKSLREQRMMMVHTLEQFEFCYQAIDYMLNNKA
ncbi:protein-tyrosine phosphatase-like protein [Coemansia spiralis]|nr:protein-tyrosine phosphatase-like protein [Coemansia spiralis]